QIIADEVPGIDLIVGGHMHQYLRHGWRSDRTGALVTEAGAFLTVAGETVLDVDDKTGRVTSSHERLVDLWLDETGEDPRVAAIVAKYTGEVSRVYDVSIATAADRLKRDPYAESSLGDWATDCEREWARADVAVTNGLGLRAELERGPVTLRSIFQVM